MVTRLLRQCTLTARPFTTERFYPISLCAKFMEGMDPRLVPGFRIRRNFPKHSTVVILRADIQRNTLTEMLVAAQRAKEDIASLDRAIK